MTDRKQTGISENFKWMILVIILSAFLTVKMTLFYKYKNLKVLEKISETRHLVANVPVLNNTSKQSGAERQRIDEAYSIGNQVTTRENNDGLTSGDSRNKYNGEYKNDTEQGVSKPNGTEEYPFLEISSDIGNESFIDAYERHCNNKQFNVTNNSSLPLCPCVPDTISKQNIDVQSVPNVSDMFNDSEVEPGGYWKPTNCYSRDRVAIVVPFRDRQPHLNILLKYLHPLLQRQQIEYRIFVVEQASPDIFNRASLSNVGYLEAGKLFQFDCVVFHDVDMIPEDDRNFYSCMNSPRHGAPYVSKFNYQLLYQYLFGGVQLFKADEFERVNGFSNKYYGWGGEDDDMFNRIRYHGIKMYRYPASVARYTMIQHERDIGNPVNYDRYDTLASSGEHYKEDGLNSLKYYVRTIKYQTLYTWIYVELPRKPT